jgi:chromosome segregation ATPase
MGAMADDFEVRMKFILEQQAQFRADMQALKDRQAENARHIEANSAQIEAHSRQLETQSGMIRQLVDVSLSLAHHIERVAEVQATTEYKLNALIDTVDKLVRRDGGAA